MSGLLVKSTVIMKEDLVTLNERRLTPPVILGGAALNRRYVEQDLRAIYKGQLFYGEDAFDGLRIMDELAARKKLETSAVRPSRASVPGVAANGRDAKTHGPSSRPTATPCPNGRRVRGAVADAAPAPDVPKPPFLGSRRDATDFDVDEVFGFINERRSSARNGNSARGA